LNEIEAAWLACAIDSEGWLYITGLQRKHWRHVVVGFQNTNKAFAEKVAAMLGGRLYERAPQTNGNVRGILPRFQVEISKHDQVAAIVEAVLPYLIVKRQNALDILAFIRSREWGQLSPEGKQRIADGVLRAWRNPEKARKRREKITATWRAKQ